MVLVLSLSTLDQTAAGVRLPLSLRYSRLGDCLFSAARSRSSSPSTSAQARLTVGSLSVLVQTGVALSWPPSLLYSQLGPFVPSARSRSPSLSTSPQARLWVV